mmetsp:Transcript_11788/g.14014  ORF Transcript_11788/g.14014 Transcript_11788/m.14014 type:complete len:615 (-) Transcript_11788:555-2399(-)|eukprot:CAMPEP_0197845720 /NCGR_PEP_ID=MMETSP1438-20131217/2613_1 /TAXON_ID=1461541 /ORGANISM="Pterosperma sp., Strain CCMP1384" /LENGTH=614 /DNA_ID=CAMNT_0043457121 /DNA_START=211 /DNA_END=2055 /DNA_ORIENTATION=-
MAVPDSPGPSKELDVKKLKEVFAQVDRNGDGHISKHEIILALRKNKELGNLLGLPTTIRQEDGSRTAIEEFFQKYDTDKSKTLEWEEFLGIIQANGGKQEVLAIDDSAPPPAPTEKEVAASLSHLGKTADGIRQAYLKVEISGTGMVDAHLLTKHPQLQKVVLKGNYLKDIKSLGKLPHLIHLDVSKNRIDDCLNIQPPTTCLRFADLSFNYLTAIRDLSAFQSLVTLKLDDNLIKEIKGLSALVTLRKLSLRNNQLSSVTGLETLSLQELDVTNNKIPSLEPLASIKTLQKLHAGQNLLTHLKGTQHITELLILDVSNNEIPTLEELQHVSQLKLLKDLSTENNLMEKLHFSRLHTLHILPGLVRLNGVAVDPKEKVHACNIHGADYKTTVEIRNKHFQNGELDDGGGSDPPTCVVLPAAGGPDKFDASVDAYAAAPAANEAAANGYDAFAAYLKEKYTSKADLVRACYAYLFSNLETVPDQPTSLKTLLKSDLSAQELALCKGGSTGNWPERLVEVFQKMMKACGIEAHVVSGYWKVDSMSKRLISPNHAWCALYYDGAWRLIDIAADKKASKMDGFFTSPEEFIKTRMPLMIRWQLMEKHVSLEQFWMGYD